MSDYRPSQRVPLYRGTRLSGRLKATPEDFQVRELPEGELAGKGDHLYLWIEKRSISTDAVVSELAQQLGTSKESIGYAGLKDTHAVTQQHISVPSSVEERLSAVDIPGVRILDTGRHTQRLRAARSKGNAFIVRVRELNRPAADALECARPWCGSVADAGWPNYFGEQRFGRGENTWTLGRRAFSGEVPLGKLGRFQRKLALSALQAGMFNAYLQDRLEEGLLTTVIGGDVLEDRRSGYLFATGLDDVEEHQQKIRERRSMITGPMVGVKMRRGARDAAKREAALMERFGVTFEALQNIVKLAPGTRRALHLWADVIVAADEDSLVFSFELPPGAYATVLLGELFDFVRTENSVA